MTFGKSELNLPIAAWIFGVALGSDDRVDDIEHGGDTVDLGPEAGAIGRPKRILAGRVRRSRTGGCLGQDGSST